MVFPSAKFVILRELREILWLSIHVMLLALNTGWFEGVLRMIE